MTPTVPASAPSGAQVVARVGAVLRAVSEHAPRAVSTTAVAGRTGLTRPTAHRLLSSLAREGFVDRSESGWLLGPELFLMGSIAADRYDISAVAAQHVHEVARLTGESAFLSALRGDETVCLVREEGSFPIRSFVLAEGVRFPLGVASAGLVMLSYLPDAEVDAYLARARLTERWGPEHADGPLRERLARTRETGYSLNPGLIVEGSWGMGAAIFDATGAPAWALSITGIETRFRPERLPVLGRILLEQAHAITLRLRAAR